MTSSSVSGSLTLCSSALHVGVVVVIVVHSIPFCALVLCCVVLFRLAQYDCVVIMCVCVIVCQ